MQSSNLVVIVVLLYDLHGAPTHPVCQMLPHRICIGIYVTRSTPDSPIDGCMSLLLCYCATCVYIYIYIHIYTCIHIYMCIYIYIYIYIYYRAPRELLGRPEKAHKMRTRCSQRKECFPYITHSLQPASVGETNTIGIHWFRYTFVGCRLCRHQRCARGEARRGGQAAEGAHAKCPCKFNTKAHFLPYRGGTCSVA